MSGKYIRVFNVLHKMKTFINHAVTDTWKILNMYFRADTHRNLHRPCRDWVRIRCNRGLRDTTQSMHMWTHRLWY